MKTFFVGFAVMTGPSIVWHLRVSARRWDALDHPSRPENHAVQQPPAAGARPGLDGSTREATP